MLNESNNKEIKEEENMMFSKKLKTKNEILKKMNQISLK